MSVRIFVPRWMDQRNNNAQNSNARALLSRFSDGRAHWTAVCSRKAAVATMPGTVGLVPVSSSRFWSYRLALAYQGQWDAIFYPGPHWADELGIKARRLLRRRRPVIATMEGIIAAPQALRQVTALTGHLVFSQPGVEAAIPRIRWIYETCDHIIAISPFLARAAKALYGDKVSGLPIGLETSIFHNRGRHEPDRARVVGCGTVKSSKRPEVFLELAQRYPEADFVWFGDGPTRHQLMRGSECKSLNNLAFPGALTPQALAEEFRRSSLFVLPSHAEGVPKVTQEAAACGLAVVLHGFYECPSVVHKENGFVTWSDEELVDAVGILLADGELRRNLGQRGAEMGKSWSWDTVAPQWEDLVIRLATS
ncbi:MAG TPA: glycosyltransferase [Terriglobales bacterium]|nr:glycosyltransferase [Terriglobales bacterium]